MANEFWVVVSYLDGDECAALGGSTDFVGCETYREALAVIQRVAPLIDHLGRCDEWQAPAVVAGVGTVELFDFAGRQLWSSEYFAGVGHVLPTAEWATGNYACRDADDGSGDAVLVPLGRPPRVVTSGELVPA